MSDFLIANPTEPAPEPAVRTNETKRTKLVEAVKARLIDVPRGTPTNQIDIFHLAVAIRTALPTGLAADDFDGNDLEQIVAEVLSPEA